MFARCADVTDIRQLIAKRWIFADAHEVPALQNVAVDIFDRKVPLRAESITGADARYILENTVESSPLRKLIHRLLCLNGPASSRPTGDNDLREHCGRPAMAWEEWQGSFWDSCKGSQKLLNSCEFHVHDDGQCCGKS